MAQAKHLAAQIKAMVGNVVGAFTDLNDCIHTYRDSNALAHLAGAAMDCVAVCCSVLQCAAVCCSVLQCVTGDSNALSCLAGAAVARCNHATTTLQPHCNHTATTLQPHCNHTATHCICLIATRARLAGAAAAHCKYTVTTLQHPAAPCSTLQHITTLFKTLLHSAAHYP